MVSGLVPKQYWREQQGPKSAMAPPPPSGPKEQSSCPWQARSLGGHRGREQNLTPGRTDRPGRERERTGGGRMQNRVLSPPPSILSKGTEPRGPGRGQKHYFLSGGKRWETEE